MLKILLFALMSTSVEGCSHYCKCTPENYPTNADCSQNEIFVIPMDLPPMIQFLNLSSNSIFRLESGFSFYSYLQTADLSRNDISEFQDNAFKSLVRLLYLDLSTNRLKSLKYHDFNGLSNLKTLNLANNYIENIFGGSVFEKTPSLNSLDLSGNRLSSLNSKTFLGLTNLQSLSLSNNYFSTLPPFQFLPQLRKLHFANNKITRIDHSPFSSFGSLNELNLSGCRMSFLPDQFFNGVDKTLESLDISDNNFNVLPKELRTLMALQDLHVGLNYFTHLPFIILSSLKNLQRFNINGCHENHGNVILSFDSNVFSENKKLQSINITFCPLLKSIPARLFDNLVNLKIGNFAGSALQVLIEDGNNWKSFDLLDLSANPLICDCSLNWIFELKNVYLENKCKEESLSDCSKNIKWKLMVSFVVLLSTLAVILVFLLLICIILRWKRRKCRNSKFKRKGMTRISKDEIKVVPTLVGNYEGYTDILLKEEKPLGNSFNYPDVKISIL